jgi:hypothetical protein
VESAESIWGYLWGHKRHFAFQAIDLWASVTVVASTFFIYFSVYYTSCLKSCRGFFLARCASPERNHFCTRTKIRASSAEMAKDAKSGGSICHMATYALCGQLMRKQGAASSGGPAIYPAR